MAGRAAPTSAPSEDFDPGRPLGSFASVTRDVLLDPGRFFAGIRTHGPLKGPVVYALACAALLVPLAGSYDVLLAAARGNLQALSGFGVPGLAGALLAGLAFFVLSPILALVGLYIGAAISQVLVRIVVGAENSGYDATLRVSAYASAVALLTWIPLIGLLAGLWGVWVSANGLRELHRTTAARALVVAAVPYAISTAFLLGQVATGETSVTEVLLRGGLTGAAGGA